MKTFLLILCCLYISINISFSQDIQSVVDRFPNEDVVTLKHNVRLDFKIINNKLSIKRNVSKQQLFLTIDKKNYASEGIYFDKFHSINEINAFTDNTNNNLKKKVKRREDVNIWQVSNFKNKDIITNGIFFGDNKQKTFTYPAVTKKSITNLNYSVAVKDPHFINPFYLGSRIPTISSEFSIKTDKNINLTYKTFNLDSVNVVFSKEINQNDIIYSWKFKNLKKATYDYDFSPLYYLPQIAVYIKKFTANGETKNVLNDVSDLYGWYQSLIKDINTTNQNELKTLTLDLIKELKTDEEKIKKIYYYVQEKINYIAFEDGLNGFIPRDAMNVFTKKYGDCKDMSNILNEMLQYANIDSYLTWIGTRSKPYSYHELPTTFTDNHMITAVKYKNEFIFLDATAKYLSFNYPSPFIQGKEALIGISKNEYKIIKVKEVKKEDNYQEIISDFIFDEKLKLIGSHSIKLTGYEKLGFKHQFSNKKKDDKDFITATFSIGNSQTIFSNEEYANLALKNDSIQITFKSYFKDYYKIIDDKIYLKLNIDKLLKNSLVKNKRKNYDKKINYKYKTSFTTSVTIPKNYILEFMPQNKSFSDTNFGFSIIYKNINNKIILTKTIYTNTLKVPVAEINKWNYFIKSLSKNNRKSIILTKKV
jgi:hypothetical protein